MADGRWNDGDGINKSHELFDKLVNLETEIGLKDDALSKAKLRYVHIHAWDMVKELAGNIEKAGENKFTVIVSEKIGSHSFVKAPKLSDFKSLLSTINLDETCQQQLKTVEAYYLKYKL